MLVAVAETPAYIARASKIMSVEEMAAVVDVIARNPTVGVVIKGANGLRKLRIPLGGRGKRGGGRVIYWYYSENNPAILLWAFAKNDQSDLTKKQLAELVKLLEE
jgi:hypothetical protein